MRSARFVSSFVVACALDGSLAWAQAPAAPANPVSAGSKMMFQIVSTYITRSADKVDEVIYAFKPTPEVRSFGQIVGHVAENNYVFCAAALGEKPPGAYFQCCFTNASTSGRPPWRMR